MKRPIASDYDGTYDEHPEIWGQVDVVVTGNWWKDYEDVMDRWSGPKKPVYFNPVDPEEQIMKIVSHKSETINRLKARRFYEDQEEQVRLLEILCPECEIILVEDEKTYL